MTQPLRYSLFRLMTQLIRKCQNCSLTTAFCLLERAKKSRNTTTYTAPTPMHRTDAPTHRRPCTAPTHRRTDTHAPHRHPCTAPTHRRPHARNRSRRASIVRIAPSLLRFARKSCCNKANEQRMRVRGTALKLGMRLAGNKPRMIRQFNHFHQTPIGRRSRNYQTSSR